MKKKRLILIPAGVIVIGLILWSAVFRGGGGDGFLFASGTVEATEARLGFLSTGRIEKIAVREGDAVNAGDELARLDRTETLARHRQAVAQVEAARAVLAELESGARTEEIAQARAARDAAAERADDTRRDYERARQLFEGGAISRESFDKTKTAQDVTQSLFTQAAERLRQLEAGPRAEKIRAQRAMLAQAEANVSAVDAALSNMVVRAPFDGVITIRHGQPGEIVPAGSAVLTIVNLDDRWVRIFVPEYRIGAVHLGSPVLITTDTYDDKTYSGEVTFIASEAEFTPKTVQTTEERVRLVYAVKVRITGDESYDLKPGMPADVELDLRIP